MSIVDEIRKAINMGRQLGGNFEKTNRKSMARGANDATIQFPCLMSKAVEIDRANSLLRLLDRTYAGFVQTYFSMNSTIDISVDPTPAHYLRRFHQNLSVESTQTDTEPEAINDVNKYGFQSHMYLSKDKHVLVVFEATNAYGKLLLDSNREQMRSYLSEYDLKPMPMSELITEAPDPIGPLDQETQEILRNTMFNRAVQQNQINTDTHNTSIQKLYSNMSAPKLTETEIKKTNDLLPYGVEIKLMAINGNQEFVNYMSFIVGVKAILHPIDSDVMIKNIIATMSNSSKIFNFVRWTSGEISFFKDFLYNVKNIRDDIKDRTTKATPYFASLRRARNKRLDASHLGVNKMIPNATIVITEYEADMIRESGYDVTNPMIAKKLLDRLFLMTFVIVDDATRTINILYDGSDDFQTYSVESLEKEVAMSSSKLSKEIGRMISY